MDLSGIPLISTVFCLLICWALFAICCSFINEAIAQLKAERGRFMKKYLFQQLQDLPNGVNWGSLVYLNGAVDLLSRAPEKPTNDIPPELFARALVEVVGGAHLVQMNKAAVKDRLIYKNSLLDDFKAATLVLKPSDVAAFLAQAMRDAELRATSDGGLDEALIYQHLLGNISDWFTGLTGRIGYWYKKKTRQRLFILGLVLACLLNADSIRLFRYYNQNTAARASLIAFYYRHERELSSIAASLDADARERQKAKDSLNVISIALKAQLDTLAASSAIPLGWPERGGAEASAGYGAWGSIALRLLGLLISAFAASFGAPFWFDVIKKIYSKPNP